MDSICSIELNEYQVANLRAAIEAIGYPYQKDTGFSNNPLSALNTGDWVGEVYNKLPKVDHPPNITPEMMVASSKENWSLRNKLPPLAHEAIRDVTKEYTIKSIKAAVTGVLVAIVTWWRRRRK